MNWDLLRKKRGLDYHVHFFNWSSQRESADFNWKKARGKLQKAIKSQGKKTYRMGIKLITKSSAERKEKRTDSRLGGGYRREKKARRFICGEKL